MNLKKFLKNSVHNLKHLDRTKTRYFTVISFVITFILFTGITYSYFYITKRLNAATITVAEMKYELTSDNATFQNNSISVPANEQLELNLNLKSLNNEETKYALNYNTTSEKTKVYFVENLEQNVSGTIAGMNSTIDINIVIDNKSNTEAASISFEIEGSYPQNEVVSNITEEYLTPTGQMLKILKIKSNGASTTLGSPATTDEGVFEMADDLGTSYYYRGNVTTNYIKFAGFYWRIIRINGDGSLRLIYDGTTPHENSEANIDRVVAGTLSFNPLANDNKYVGYMYGPAGTTASKTRDQARSYTVSSSIKTTLDNWYKTNIVDKGFSGFIEDSIFCNDRSIKSGVGYGNNETSYGINIRLYNNVSFSCPEDIDKFTVSSQKGNGALTYPIGLITADEIEAAGSGTWGSANTSYYLHKGYGYWAMTPSSHPNSGVYGVFTDGSMKDFNTQNSYYLAPVINIKNEKIFSITGSGTTDEPFIIN